MNDTPTDSSTLEGLLARTAVRERAAFEQLYLRTSPRLFALCVRVMRDRGEAEEVLQEPFIAVWRRAEAFNPALASASTWLTTLVRNRAIDRLCQRREDIGADPLDLDRLPDEERGLAAHAANLTSRLRRHGRPGGPDGLRRAQAAQEPAALARAARAASGDTALCR